MKCKLLIPLLICLTIANTHTNLLRKTEQLKRHSKQFMQIQKQRAKIEKIANTKKEESQREANMSKCLDFGKTMATLAATIITIILAIIGRR